MLNNTLRGSNRIHLRVFRPEPVAARWDKAVPTRETREDFTGAVYPASLSPSSPMPPVLPRPGFMLAVPFLTHEMAMSGPAPFDRPYGRLVHQIRMLHIAQPFELRTDGAACSRRPVGRHRRVVLGDELCLHLRQTGARLVCRDDQQS